MNQDPFDTLYSNRPRLVVHSSLRNCISVIELAKLAKSKGYEVEVQDARMINDVILSEGYDAGAPRRSHSIRSARLFLERHPGVD